MKVWMLLCRVLDKHTSESDPMLDASGKPYLYKSREVAETEAKKLAGSGHVVWQSEHKEYTDEFQSVWKWGPSKIYLAASVEIMEEA